MIDKSINKNNLNSEMLVNYFTSLVNQFFKILPIRENEEASLQTYVDSLQLELLGLKEFIPELKQDPLLIKLISILQYFKDNPTCEVSKVKREVFKSIGICNKLKATYAEKEVVNNE